MRDHALFGGCLRSEIPFPELPLAECGQPDWTFRRGTEPLPPSDLLGNESVDATVKVQCGRLRDGFRLAFDDTGTFDIIDGGRVVEWTPGPLDALELVRADLLGSVFSIALHVQGLLCLHSSAVAVSGGALAFVAHKGTGKSTLATALCAAGATLITDDMLPVQLSDPVIAWPSTPAVRLLPDSASHLGYASRAIHPATGKYHVKSLPEHQVERRRLPLAAVYEITQAAHDAAAPAVRRTAVNGAAALAILLRHNRVGTAIGASESANLFTRAADLARSVPVYRLEIARDLVRLPEVVEQIKGWHVGSTGESSSYLTAIARSAGHFRGLLSTKSRIALTNSGRRAAPRSPT